MAVSQNLLTNHCRQKIGFTESVFVPLGQVIKAESIFAGDKYSGFKITVTNFPDVGGGTVTGLSFLQAVKK